jgi:hypothetical protein
MISPPCDFDGPASFEAMPVNAEVRLDAYAIVRRAVEEGVARGYRRAFKHSDAPSGDWVREAIEQDVLSSLCEVLRFS